MTLEFKMKRSLAFKLRFTIVLSLRVGLLKMDVRVIEVRMVLGFR